MTNKRNKTYLAGAPLAVCVNDCEIDYGQPHKDLISVCFQLGCAFAELRWGGDKPNSSVSPFLATRVYQIAPTSQGEYDTPSGGWPSK